MCVVGGLGLRGEPGKGAEGDGEHEGPADKPLWLEV